MYGMKYYVQTGSEYTLIRNKLSLFWFLLGAVLLFAASTLFEGNTVDEKVALWTARVLGALLLLGAVSLAGKKVVFDTRTREVTAVTGLLRSKKVFSFDRFSHIEVLKETYSGFIPIGVSVKAYFVNDEGKEAPILLRQVLFTLATRWAQQLVDETESLLKTH